MSKHRMPTVRSAYVTSVTRQHLDGKPLRDCAPDMTRRSGPGNSKRYRRSASA